jgi:YkoY family integral membrane protein
MNPGDVLVILMAVLWLVFLEGLLSADNALVMAMMVRHLPKNEQMRVLWYGMWGAFVFRFIAVFLAKLLLRFWALEVVGGVYLVYLAAAHFLAKSSQAEAESQGQRFGTGFWASVISVELADIAFSIDSILAAVAVGQGLPESIGENGVYAIVVTGGILGIITMRYIAGYFLILLERFRGLEPGAYGLVAWIGLKLITSGLHRGKVIHAELNPWVFWLGMLAILVMGFLYQPKSPPPPEESIEIIDEWFGVGGDAGHASPGQGEPPGSDGDDRPDGAPGEGGPSGRPPAAGLPARPS